MDIDKTILAGVGGVLIGAVLSYAVGSSGRSSLEAQLRQAGDVSATVAGLSETIGGLDERLAALDARIVGLEGAVAAAGPTQQAELQSLAGRVDGLGAELSGAVQGLGASLSGALGAEIKGLGARLSELSGEGAAAGGPGKGGAAGGAADAAPAAGPGAGATVLTGGAASLGDGALRVFLSAVDPAAGTARVAVNGVATTEVALGETTAIGGCELTLTGFAPGGATLDATCGGPGAQAARGQAAAGQAAAGQAAAGQAAEGQAATGSGAEVRVGAATTLAEGALRVFLSATDPEAGVARAAINGVATTALALGAPVDAGPCRVTLTGFTEAGATLDGACSAAPAAGDGAADAEAVAANGAAGAAEAEPRAATGATAAGDAAAGSAAGAAAADATGGGGGLTPGQTGLFADGRVRVFVSAVDAPAGIARVAVNGTELRALRTGAPETVDGCTLTLRGVGADGAVVEAAC